MTERLVSVRAVGGPTPAIVTDDDVVIPLLPILERRGVAIGSAREILALWDELSPLIRAEVARGAFDGIALGDARLGPPIADPGQVVAVGFNYGSHLDAGRALAPSPEPVVFMKSPGSVIGPHDQIVRPEGVEALDYEIEVAVVIGRPGYRIPRDRAAEHVAGYLLANDITARDTALPNGFETSPLQAQIARGKGRPTFCPTGPWMLMHEAAMDEPVFEFDLRVNGEVRQSGSTKEMNLGFAEIIETVSSSLALRAGDIVLTGTPAGCGFQFDPPRYLRAGDTVEAWSPQLGSMRTTVSDEHLDPEGRAL